MITRTELLDLIVKIHSYKNCSVKEATEEAKEQLKLTDKEVIEILEGN